LTDRSTVDFLNDATVGDLVWFYDGNRNRFDPDGKYEGRGVWNLAPIKAETRRSFMVQYSKFDRKSGAPMATGGYTSPYKIRGQKEYEALVWMREHSRKIIAAVERCRDIDKLKQVAEIVGYVE